MNRPLLCLASLIMLGASALAEDNTPKPLERTMSQSQQFVIYGATPTARMNIARRAETLSDIWKKSTGMQGKWRWPIIINLLPSHKARWSQPDTRLYVGDADSVKIQIDAPDSLPRASDLDLSIFRALTLEAMYRRYALKPGKSYSSPPPWLVEALWQQSSGADALPASLYEKLIETGPPPSLKDFLREKPERMDSTSRAVYRARAGALLTALEETPEGASGIEDYLSALPDSKWSDPKTILQAFPSLESDPTRLAKLWTLSIAGLSRSRSVGSLSARDTRSQLEGVLSGIRPLETADNPDRQGASVMPELSKDRRGRFLLARINENFQRLEATAHPLYRPLIQEYRLISAQLTQKYRKDAVRRIAAAEELRKALNARTDSVTDHMNWFEAAKVSTPSEPLPDEYALPALDQESTTRSNDPIADYLDTVEKRMP